MTSTFLLPANDLHVTSVNRESVVFGIISCHRYHKRCSSSNK